MKFKEIFKEEEVEEPRKEEVEPAEPEDVPAEEEEEASEESKVEVKLEDVAERMAEKIARAIKETGKLNQADSEEFANKFFSPKTGMRGIEYPSELGNLSKNDKIVLWFKSLFEKDRDPEANRVFKALVEGTDSQGGYLVPEEFRAEVFRILPDMSVMRKLARILPMNTDTLNLNTLDAEPAAYWTSEYASKSTTSAEFGRVTLQPNDLVCLLPVTQQLVADANIDIVRFVTQLFAEKIARTEDKAYFTGSGSGQPKGISQETITTVSAGGVLDFDDIIQLVYSKPQSVRASASAAFVANRKVIEILHKVKDSNGRYIWTPMATSDLAKRPLDVILGYPVYEQNDLSEDQMYFGDWSFYVIGDRQSLAVETTREGGDAWRRNSIEIKAVVRVDGKTLKTGAFAKITGIQS